MSAASLAQTHVNALTELLARCAPGDYARSVIEQRLAEARAALNAVDPTCGTGAAAR